MKANDLERAVIERLLADRGLRPLRHTVDLDSATVSERSFTGAGFLTEFERSEQLRLFECGVSLRWGKAGARLNATGIETGYVVYVDDGYVTTVEGYTYGDAWPGSIEQIELYEIAPGTALRTPPRDPTAVSSDDSADE